MDIKGKTVWQIAAGNGDNTHYAKECLRDGIILIGPGGRGPWPDCEAAVRKDRNAIMAGIIRRFAEDILVGDVVVLRVGTQHAYGVGVVTGAYSWSEKYSNVQGWDLQHHRTVRWIWKADPAPKQFPVYSLKFGSSVQRLISPEVMRWIESL